MDITNNAKVGMVVVATLILLGIITVEMGVWNKKRDMGVPYYVLFDNVSGLLPGAAVLKAGVNVGKVSSLTIIGQKEPESIRDKVRVTILIKDPKERLTKNSIYMISTNLMGDKWLEISPKTGPEMAVATHIDKPWLDDHAVGVTPASMDQLMLQAEDAIRKLDIAATSFNQLMGDPKVQQDMKTMISSISRLTDNLTTLSTTANKGLNNALIKFDGIMSDAESLMSHVDHLVVNSDVQINGLMTSLRNITDTNSASIAKITKNMEETSHSLNLAMKSVQQIAGNEKFADSILTTLDNISLLSQELKQMAEDLQEITGDPEIKSTLKNTIKETHDTIEGVNKIVKRFNKGSAFLNGRLAQIDAEVTQNGYDNKIYGNANLELLPYGNHMMKLGVEDIGTGNHLNLQYGRNYGSIRPRAGIIRSKLGLGADAFFNKNKNLELSVDAYNTSDIQVDLLGKYVMKNGFYIMGGVRDTFDTKQGIVGVGKRF